MVTKSGTKEFHGDLFEYVRNDAFDANDWFLNQAQQPRNPLKRNNWGFTLGGPVFIPGHYNKDRNKTFFLRLRRMAFLPSGHHHPPTGPFRIFSARVISANAIRRHRTYDSGVAAGCCDSDKSQHRIAVPE